MYLHKRRLLLVEDDLDLAKAMIEYLMLEEIECDHASNGLSGLTLVEQGHYDLLVLDLNLPKLNGLDVCTKLRRKGIDVPVLMLTARDTLDDKLNGFSCGADDYLVKPFAMEELIARAKVLSRRRSGQTEQLTCCDLNINLSAQQVNRSGKVLQLSPIGFTLLETLMRASPNVVSREKLIQAVWGDEPPDSNSLKVHIFHLRKVIDKDFDNKLIRTVTSRGFALKCDVSE
ncbi:response regulator transcription factor [Vibrio ostreicida]|uniref:Response regulator transcription factor n=1 Tax=Vibrio ostreicida TaxID=526588 RepID=A0ABT8BTS8_9VIBR|nr:response regulator transcription factor [Vibrio ostreicida]MDN3609779.1 response regulator transcription factor [Vibrio ostreicida]NPD09393.1 response regulator transcription factor [Vibrio ostreicida]